MPSNEDSQSTAIGCLAVIVIGGAFAMCSSDDDAKEPEASQTEAAAATTETEEPAEPKEPEVTGEVEIKADGEYKTALARLIVDDYEDAVGRTVNWDPPKLSLVSVEVAEHGTEDGYVVTVDSRGSDSLTADMVANGITLNFKDFARKAFSHDPVSELVCWSRLPLKDQYGDISEDRVARHVLYRDQAEKINWDGITLPRLRKLALRWQHPAISK